MNPLSFTVSITTEYMENFIDKLNKVVDVMDVDDKERVGIFSNQSKSVARSRFY